MIFRSSKESLSSRLTGDGPTVAFFCATFLKPEMHHVHRQVSALTRCRSLVLTQKLENAATFPFEPIHLIPRSPWRFVARSWSDVVTHAPWQISAGEVALIRKHLKEAGADVLHIFFGSVAIHLLPLLQELEIPAVVSFHGADVAGEMRSPGYALAVGEVFARASAITARSAALAAEVKRMGCPARKVSLQRTLLPEISGHPRSAPPDGAWKLLQVARLVPKKGISTALRAFAGFHEKFPGSKFVIAGDGPMRRELSALAEELGLGDRVEFTGFLPQDQVRSRMAASHIYLHPSETVKGTDQEGVPNAMLEAMASGLPVVATNHGGIPEAVREGIDGFLVKEGDVKALEKALQAMAANSGKFAAMSVSARDHALREYGPQGAARMEEIYWKLHQGELRRNS